MERSPLDSTAVASVGYDDLTLVLEIEFRTGRIYQYEGVPRGVYDWLLRTPSKGAYVSRMISNRYEFRDVTQPDVEPEAETDLTQLLRDSVRWLDER